MSVQQYLLNLQSVQAQIRQACVKSGRAENEIRLITVTKTVDATQMSDIYRAGMHEFAENRWQQARDKVMLTYDSEVQWHFIGTLQKNKVKYIVPHFQWIHSVDSLEMAQVIDAYAEKCNKVVNILLQVNISGEVQKHGISSEEIGVLLQNVLPLSHIKVRGLMTMAPKVSEMEETRPIFRKLKWLLDDWRNQLELTDFIELSMGMSDDFPIAIEEGSTMIRVGRRLLQMNN